MLLQFSVTNHRSIHGNAVLSLAATPDREFQGSLLSPDGKRNILPVAAIYGANAAGKSNVLHALDLMRSMVVGEYAKPLKDTPLPQEPFAFTDEEEPTKLEAIYFYEGIKYAFGFSFTREKIVEEYLYHWRNGREGLVFSRKNGEYVFREKKAEQMVLAGRTSENRLYLVTSNEWNNQETQDAYLWFSRKLNPLQRDNGSYDQTLSELERNGGRKKKILREMVIADLGIVDVKVSGSKEKPVIMTTHRLLDEDGNESDYDLLIQQESAGTQRFFSRIGSWLKTLETGGTLIVDEIESSMHPLLTRHLIEAMQDKEINTNQAQLIFTTHDVGLLDQKLLRRDQIWFAEKNEKNAETDLYSLTDFSPRKGENIQKGYMQGRYGAIPFISGGEGLWQE